MEIIVLKWWRKPDAPSAGDDGTRPAGELSHADLKVDEVAVGKMLTC